VLPSRQPNHGNHDGVDDAFWGLSNHNLGNQDNSTMFAHTNRQRPLRFPTRNMRRRNSLQPLQPPRNFLLRRNMNEMHRIDMGNSTLDEDEQLAFAIEMSSMHVSTENGRRGRQQLHDDGLRPRRINPPRLRGSGTDNDNNSEGEMSRNASRRDSVLV